MAKGWGWLVTVPLLSSEPLLSMHLVFPGSWLGTGCIWPSSGKSQRSRPEPMQRRTA